jgi:hypothetical protein
LASETASGPAKGFREQYQKQYPGGRFDKLLFPAPAAKANRR